MLGFHKILVVCPRLFRKQLTLAPYYRFRPGKLVDAGVRVASAGISSQAPLITARNKRVVVNSFAKQLTLTPYPPAEIFNRQ